MLKWIIISYWYNACDITRFNFYSYFIYDYSNFENYDKKLVTTILKNDPFICSDKLFIKIKDEQYYFNDIDKVIYLLIEQREKKLKRNFYNKEYLKL